MKGIIRKNNIINDEYNNYNIDITINNVTYNVILNKHDNLSTLYNKANIEFNKQKQYTQKEDFEHLYIKNNKTVTQKYWVITETIDNLYLCDTYDNQCDKIPNNHKLKISNYFSDELLSSNNDKLNTLLDSYCNILHFLKNF
jgi:hypothetical protein